MINYQQEENLSVEEFKSVLLNSTLGERRPIGESERLSAMLKHANLIITARDNGKLVGIARSLTDFAFCTYLSDLAVDENYQKMGIGKQLLDAALALAKSCGYQKIRLDTLNTMLPAMKLYTDNGFYEILAYYFNPEKTAVYFEKEL